MPARKTALQEKRADQAKLKQLNRVVITLEASELNLQRIAALLVFATVPYELEEAPPLGPLPWEDPNDPRYQQPPTGLQIDYAVVKVDTVKLLQKAVVAGIPMRELEEIVQQHGGKTVAEIPQDRLLDLNAALNYRLNPKATE